LANTVAGGVAGTRRRDVNDAILAETRFFESNPEPWYKSKTVLCTVAGKVAICGGSIDFI